MGGLVIGGPSITDHPSGHGCAQTTADDLRQRIAALVPTRHHDEFHSAQVFSSLAGSSASRSEHRPDHRSEAPS